MNREGKNSTGVPKSLCWDCANSTNSEVCPWARELTPVKGWDAKPYRLGGVAPMDSYIVSDCPLFKRDSFGAGAERCLMTQKKKPPTLYNDDLKNIAEAIIEGAVEDWKALQYGALEYVRFRGDRITKKDTLEFFFSKDFEDFLGTFSERTPQQIRSWLQITDDMMPLTPQQKGALMRWQTMKSISF